MYYVGKQVGNDIGAKGAIDIEVVVVAMQEVGHEITKMIGECIEAGVLPFMVQGAVTTWEHERRVIIGTD